MNREEYLSLAFRLNFIFEFVRNLFSEEELKEFLDYIEQADTTLPLTNPTMWDNHYHDIDKARERVKALLSMVEVIKEERNGKANLA